MVTKICPVCKKEFVRTHNRQVYCSKTCSNKIYYKSAYPSYEKRKAYLDNWRKTSDAHKKYRQSDKRKEYQRMYQESAKGKESAKKYRQSDKSKKRLERYNEQEWVKEKLKKYEKSDRGKKIRATRKGIRRKNEPLFKLKLNMRDRIGAFLKVRKMQKNNTTFSLIGCTPEFLKEYLEKKFYPHPKTNALMTWKNHTTNGWHVDHIKPLDSCKNEDDLPKLCHYTNLQPMWAEENRKKSNK